MSDEYRMMNDKSSYVSAPVTSLRVATPILSGTTSPKPFSGNDPQHFDRPAASGSASLRPHLAVTPLPFP